MIKFIHSTLHRPTYKALYHHQQSWKVVNIWPSRVLTTSQSWVLVVRPNQQLKKGIDLKGKLTRQLGHFVNCFSDQLSVGFHADRRIPLLHLTSIDNFRIAFSLLSKASPYAHPFVWKLVFIWMWIKTNFYMKRWAPGLALKKRPKVITEMA